MQVTNGAQRGKRIHAHIHVSHALLNKLVEQLQAFKKFV